MGGRNLVLRSQVMLLMLLMLLIVLRRWRLLLLLLVGRSIALLWSLFALVYAGCQRQDSFAGRWTLSPCPYISVAHPASLLPQAIEVFQLQVGARSVFDFTSEASPCEWNSLRME